MLKKKHTNCLINFVLIAAMLFALPASAFAAEVSDTQASDESSAAYTLRLVYVQSGENKCLENALQDKAGNWYFTADTIGKYTGYVFDAETLLWSKYQETGTSYQTDKKITVDPAAASLMVQMLNTSYPVTASALPIYGGQIWFPIHQTLPLMETVAWVEDGVLCIEAPVVSFEDAFHGWKLDELMFDEEAEFAGQGWTEAIMIGSAMAYDTVGELNLKRLFSYLTDGGVEDYETVFTDYLTDTDAYELAFSDSAQVYGWIASSAKNVSEINKQYGLSLKGLKSLKGLAGSAEARMISIGNLDEDDLFLTEAFEEVIPTGVMDTLSVIGDMAKLTADCYKYSKNYALALQDNRDMLAVVFGAGESPEILEELSYVGSALSAESAMRKASANVYEFYSADDINDFYWDMSSKMLEDLLMEKLVWDQVDDFVFEALLGLDSWYSAAAAAEKALLDEIWEAGGITASDDLALLYHHLNVLDAAYETFRSSLQGGVGATAAACRQKDMEELRLSAVMTLLSSKKCFEILRDNNKNYNEFVSYCENRIQNITRQLAVLYLAAESVMIDGVEYFNSAIPELEEELIGLPAAEGPSEISDWQVIFNTQYWPSSQDAPNAQVNSWYNMSVSDIYLKFADLTGDGVLEMIVAAVGSSYEDGGPVTALQVLTLADNEYGYTSLYYCRIDSYSTLHNDIQIGIARDAQGQCGILEVWDSNWQGYRSSYYVFNSYTADGTGNGTVYGGWDEAFGKAQMEEISAQYSDMELLLYATSEKHSISGMHASSWFAYLEERNSWIFEAGEDMSDYVDDGGLSASVASATEEWEYEEEDPWMDYVIQELTTNTWQASIDGHSLSVHFTGGKADLMMHVFIDADPNDYSAEVMLRFGSGIDVQIIDNQAYTNNLPSFFPKEWYSIYYNPETSEIYLYFGNGGSYVFSSTTGVVLE